MDISLRVERNPRFPWLPRFGVRLFLPAAFGQAEYFAYGPTESYADKHQATRLGVYAQGVEELSTLTGRRFSSINIVGGGSQDRYLNQLTANASGLPVYAGPTEGTALGNLLVQMIAAGEFPGLEEARQAIATSFSIEEVLPC